MALHSHVSCHRKGEYHPIMILLVRQLITIVIIRIIIHCYWHHYHHYHHHNHHHHHQRVVSEVPIFKFWKFPGGGGVIKDLLEQKILGGGGVGGKSKSLLWGGGGVWILHCIMILICSLRSCPFMAGLSVICYWIVWFTLGLGH